MALCSIKLGSRPRRVRRTLFEEVAHQADRGDVMSDESGVVSCEDTDYSHTIFVHLRAYTAPRSPLRAF